MASHPLLDLALERIERWTQRFYELPLPTMGCLATTNHLYDLILHRFITTQSLANCPILGLFSGSTHMLLDSHFDRPQIGLPNCYSQSNIGLLPYCQLI